MKRYTLERVYLENQTLGSIYDENRELICKTVELPYRNNQRSIDASKASAIPEGIYPVKKNPPKPARNYGYFRLSNTEPRQGILIHRITNTEDLRGCIGVGTRFSNIDNDQEYEMLSSGVKLQWMYDNLPDEFELEIKKKATSL
jgi:Family of unknown function (DUF5675)